MTHRQQIEDIMTDPTSDAEIDQILYKFHSRVFLDGDVPNMSYIEEAKASLIAWRNRYAEEIIGEDEDLEPWDGDTNDAFDRNTYKLKRNRLRAEQRARLAALTTKDKGEAHE